TLLQLAYLVSSVLFIFSLKGLSSQETARQGNLYGVAGMGLAVIATLLNSDVQQHTTLLLLVAIGAVIGYTKAKRVEMTEMPELVALLHSFVGAAAVLVGFASDRGMGAGGHPASGLYAAEIGVDVAIGALTFTGSVVAFLKLKGGVRHPALQRVPYLKEIAGSKPLLLPNRHALNAGAALACVGLIWLYAAGAAGAAGAAAGGAGNLWLVGLLTLVAGALGAHLVVAIGGADMPVVVSMLNSYSGWTASAAGFMLNNDLLIITGALVGSSGAILSYIMCRSMNRSIVSVIFGGFGAEAPAAPAVSAEEQAAREVREVDAEGLTALLSAARSVVVVPGYGLAQARAAGSVYALTQALRARGVDVRFAIHPVAGRLPGHMNILLAEARVPYDIVFELEDINDDFPATDVVLVIGANDIVNPLAQDDPSCPIAGMEVLEVWKAKTSVVFKRSRASGYAGIDNPLFYKPNNLMFFGDAAKSLSDVVTRLKG
ncbi:MAG: NAD(P)(+) transhydrogenase (Re/Si-specific) subunit beta, partial [Deltaproteobacteria bacterium]|nr:NAD(P)(+) transhydrogenase (Re/Si-specific) subunit beta [Deltaproteobacteria bacterium]